MEIQLLGPVEVLVGGQRLDVGHAKQRAVLAVLLLEANHLVPADRLIDRVWGQEPPKAVRNVLHGYLARLRAALNGAADPGVSLARQAGGYVLTATDEHIDLLRFRSLVSHAEAVGDDERAAVLLREALTLWDGEPLGGVSSAWLAAMRETLERQKIAALLDLNDIELRLGNHQAQVSPLADQAAAYPADERLIGQLMLALYRSGRQAEALRWFDQTRHRLADELGADPGPELRSLHQRILRGDPSLAPPARDDRTGQTPRQLPLDVTAFTGRTAELAELDRLIADRSGPAGFRAGPHAMVISAVSGTAGVGKTALAVRWAHAVAERFPDGQLYVNLRGYDPVEPAQPADALAGFLRALGVPGPDIAPDPDQRAAQYRSLLAGRQVLVLLDNASDADQVRPLLPGTPGCVAVVTSRDSLAGLVARDGARRLYLDLLPADEAVALLRTLIGARSDAEPDATRALAARCARLPLALRLAAELAASRPGVTVSELVAELADERARLNLLAADGDRRTAIRAVFSWSLGQLDPDAARAFSLLGVHPGNDFDIFAGAALLGTTAQAAQPLIDRLVRASLVQPAGNRRYGLHDLLRGYALDLLADGRFGPAELAAAGLLDYYLDTATAAIKVLFPDGVSQRRELAPGPAAKAISGQAEATDWLEAELPNLVAVASQAGGYGLAQYAINLSAIMWAYLESRGHYPELLEVCGSAEAAAKQAGDRTAEAEALHRVTVVHLRQGSYRQAADLLKRALAIYQETGDRKGESFAVNNLGIASFLEGRYKDAAGYHRHALALKRETGNRASEPSTLINLSLIDIRQGRYAPAKDQLEEALAILGEQPLPSHEVLALANLGVVHLRTGHCELASDYLQRALKISREIADVSGEPYLLTHLGLVRSRQGNDGQAIELIEQSVTICHETGDRSGEAEARNALGDALRSAGKPELAISHHAIALGIAEESGDLYEQARAHGGLGNARLISGDETAARQSWLQAVALYDQLEAPEAEEIRQLLKQRP